MKSWSFWQQEILFCIQKYTLSPSWLHYFEIYFTCSSTFLSYWLSKSSTNRHNIRWMTYLRRVLHWKHKNFQTACGHVERTTKWNTIKSISFYHDFTMGVIQARENRFFPHLPSHYLRIIICWTIFKKIISDWLEPPGYFFITS